MTSTMPMRIDGDLFEVAKSIGAVESRSAAQQISHWARIGRELESSPGTTSSDIRRVLAGEPGVRYDTLDERDQAVVRATWDERVADRLAKLNLAEQFTRDGQSWSEADEQGNVVVRNAPQANSTPATHSSAR